MKKTLKVVLMAATLAVAPMAVMAEGGARGNSWGINTDNSIHNTALSAAASKSQSSSRSHSSSSSNAHAQGGAGGDGGDANQIQGQVGIVKGGNISNTGPQVDISLEGDDYPVSSAFAGQASGCVNTAGVQSSSWGASVGGASAKCLAQQDARFFLQMASDMNALGLTKERDKFIVMAINAAKDAEPNGFEKFTKEVKDWAMDAGIPVALVYALFLL